MISTMDTSKSSDEQSENPRVVIQNEIKSVIIEKSDKNVPYKSSEAAEILLEAIANPNKSSSTTFPKLKGGESYVYHYTDDKKANDWRSDVYRFGSFQTGPRESGTKVKGEKMRYWMCTNILFKRIKKWPILM